MLAALIFFMHRDNIRRLLRGEEPRIGSRGSRDAHTLDDSERRAWLRLARTEHVGPVTFASLIARFGTARRGAGRIAAPGARAAAATISFCRRNDDIDARTGRIWRGWAAR